MVDKIFDKSHLDNTEEDKKEQKKSDLFEDMVTDEEKIDANASADDILKSMQKQIDSKSTQRKQKRLDEYNAKSATKSLLFSRIGKTIDVPIVVSDDDVLIFKIKRLSEADNADILDRSLAVKDLEEMTAEELEESNDYNYRLLERCVVEPEMTASDWKRADTALVQKLIREVTKVLSNVDDTALFDDFRKK